MILVDTSVWIAVFRRRKPFDLEAVAAFEEVVTCLPVIQEVLQGFREEAAFRAAEEAMFSLPVVETPLSEAVFRDAVALYRTGRSVGTTVRSSVDCLIAACALRHDLEVLHADRDFEAIASYSGLRQRKVG
ncbi:MAG: PIN domain-containing protein [Planctomycetota bacterium]